MTASLHHRGPDAGGAWLDLDQGLALGHRRLSVVDLSAAGSQPMCSHSGRSLLVFNGEIYNCGDIRDQLEQGGHSVRWRGHSDTEILLEAIEHWGVERALREARGMFALAVWDRKKRELVLARDRMGEKPLYVGWCAHGLVFASELKALTQCPHFSPSISPLALSEYLRYGYVPDPLTIFASARKVAPGATLTFRTPQEQPEAALYWSLVAAASSGKNHQLQLSHSECCDMMEACLSEVVQSQMLGDVPQGCFLSGGIDSSLIAALMVEHSGSATRTFSIGFDKHRFNEARYAQQVAKHLGSSHTEFILTEEDALAVVYDLPVIYDEPFADSSQIPTTVLSRLARSSITVALTGDGGDEIFAGYNRYAILPRAWGILRRMPFAARRSLGSGMMRLERLGVDDNSIAHRIAEAAGLPRTTFEKIALFGRAVSNSRDIGSLHRGVASIFESPSDVLLGEQCNGCGKQVSLAAGPFEEAERLMVADAVTYLPGDILTKVDRASMSSSLETRAPFLDARVVELAWRVPLASKLSSQGGKRILRDILYRHVPRKLVDRPKQGFSIPLDGWLQGKLRGWAEDLLSPWKLTASGLLDVDSVHRLWAGHLNGRMRSGHKIWALLMLQAWLDHIRGEAATGRGSAEEASLVVEIAGTFK